MYRLIIPVIDLQLCDYCGGDCVFNTTCNDLQVVLVSYSFERRISSLNLRCFVV